MGIWVGRVVFKDNKKFQELTVKLFFRHSTHLILIPFSHPNSILLINKPRIPLEMNPLKSSPMEICTHMELGPLSSADISGFQLNY